MVIDDAYDTWFKLSKDDSCASTFREYLKNGLRDEINRR